ncbi:MAG: hypothetical protein KF785_09235 [Gemmatimonadales bacterium]|nr:hypothetical protein [Gemmatimonadales bacterium]
MKSSVILRTGGRLLLPVSGLFSLYILLRGHNEPGGGFIGGLIAAAGLAIYALPRGREALYRVLLMRPATLAALGLLLAVSGGLPGLLVGEQFLAHQWAAPGGFAIGTTLIFDAGVYLVVVGSVLLFLSLYLED